MIEISLEREDLAKLAQLVAGDVSLEVLDIEPEYGVKLKLSGIKLLPNLTFAVFPSLVGENGVILELKRIGLPGVVNAVGGWFGLDVAALAARKSNGVLKRLSPTKLSAELNDLCAIFGLPGNIRVDSLQIESGIIAVSFEFE